MEEEVGGGGGEEDRVWEGEGGAGGAEGEEHTGFEDLLGGESLEGGESVEVAFAVVEVGGVKHDFAAVGLCFLQERLFLSLI